MIEKNKKIRIIKRFEDTKINDKIIYNKDYNYNDSDQVTSSNEAEAQKHNTLFTIGYTGKRAAKFVLRSLGIQRSDLAYARMAIERYYLASKQLSANRKAGRILCYHAIGLPAWGVNNVTPKQFRSHIELALKNGFRFVPASKIAAGQSEPTDLAITFDDGLACLESYAAPILEGYGIPWSVFLVSDWTEHQKLGNGLVLTWQQVGNLAERGVEIGSHSATHPDFATLNAAQTTYELTQSRDMIEQRLGLAPTSFAIPFGQSANWHSAATHAAREAGYSHIYAQAEETRPASTIARTFVTSFDNPRIFKALLCGAYDQWEEWL